MQLVRNAVLFNVKICTRHMHHYVSGRTVTDAHSVCSCSAEV